MIEHLDSSLVDWSRAQFALTAIYHWLFVPLTLGLGIVMAVMETIYYRTGKEFWISHIGAKPYHINPGIQSLDQFFLRHSIFFYKIFSSKGDFSLIVKRGSPIGNKTGLTDRIVSAQATNED